MRKPGGLGRFAKHPLRIIHNRLTLRWRNRHDRDLKRALTSQLIGSKGCSLPPGTIDIAATQLNEPATAQIMAALEPDVLITSGAPILKRALLALPRRAALNIHFEIAPNYRGQHTLFWSAYRRDYCHIGVTLHHLARGVDTGNILARVYPELAESDDEATLFAKCSRAIAEMLQEFLLDLETVERCPPGSAQDVTLGATYRYIDRGICSDCVYGCKRSLGLIKFPAQCERNERFF